MPAFGVGVHWFVSPQKSILREVRRRTRVVGAFPDGNSALMLVAARLRHIAGTRWGTRRYLNCDRSCSTFVNTVWIHLSAAAGLS